MDCLALDDAEPDLDQVQDLESGEQGGAVADIVVGLALRNPDLHRQHRHRPVRRLDLGLLVQHSTIAFSGGCMYSPTISVTLPASCGSVENLNVSARHGATPYSRHTDTANPQIEQQNG
jgi:hypothetical protein